MNPVIFHSDIFCLEGQTLSFSGLISSSNTFETDDVTEIYVRSDHPLLCIISTIGND